VTDDAIWDAFCIRLSAFAGGYSPAMAVIFDGVGGEPPNLDEWIEARYFPNRTRNYGVSAGQALSLVGFCQAAICIRPGGGLNRGLDIARDLIAYFDHGTLLGPSYVSQPPYVSTVVTEPQRLMFPVTIPYAAHGSR
jgi:hypothetical protein